MSTETTNKKIKIDNGTTFGRTYTDKAVDELLKNAGSGGTSVIELTDKNGTIASAQLGKINANPQNFAFKYSGKILSFTKADSTTYQYCNNTTNSSDNNVMTTSTLLTIESSTGVYTITENVHNVVANSIHPANGGDLTNIQVGSKVYSIPSGGGKPLLDMYPYYNANTQTISQEGLNLLQQKFVNNEIVGVSFGAEASCMILDTMAETGLVFAGPYQVGLGIFKATINMESGAVASGREEKINNLVLPSTSPTSQLIPSITTTNTQQNLTVGSGLEIKNGVLDIKSNVVKINTYSINIDKTEISTTAEVGILSFAESAKTKNTALFNLLAQNENNILNIKVKLNIVDGTSFLIFMDYHKASAINVENIQGVVLSSATTADYHVFTVNEYQSNINLQEYYTNLSSVDVVVNYY